MSTKTKTKIKKLPKCLPPLPPVPAGYDAWQYMGRGYVSTKNECFAHASESTWWDIEKDDRAIGDICTTLHYIIPIKHPAPKPAAKGRKAVKDWTEKDGKSNSSDKYFEAVSAVNQLIQDSAHKLIGGYSHDVARLIVSQLAHKHNLSPSA